MSDREQLAHILYKQGAYCGTCDYESRCMDCERVLDGYAAAILTAGFRPPAQVITDPVELDALPIHSVALAPSGYPWWLTGLWPIPSWSLAGNHRTSAELLADCRGEGVIVLHLPTETGDADGQL